MCRYRERDRIYSSGSQPVVHGPQVVRGSSCSTNNTYIRVAHIITYKILKAMCVERNGVNTSVLITIYHLLN